MGWRLKGPAVSLAVVCTAKLPGWRGGGQSLDETLSRFVRQAAGCSFAQRGHVVCARGVGPGAGGVLAEVACWVVNDHAGLRATAGQPYCLVCLYSVATAECGCVSLVTSPGEGEGRFKVVEGAASCCMWATQVMLGTNGTRPTYPALSVTCAVVTPGD